MYRPTLVDLPRLATIGFVAVTLAIIGFYISVLIPAFVYAFPNVWPSNPGTTMIKRSELPGAKSCNCAKLSITQFNTSIEVTSSLIRPRPLVASRCVSIPANWGLARGTHVRMTRRSSKLSKLRQFKTNMNLKLKPRASIEGSPAAVLKAARDNIRRVPRPRLTIANSSSFRKEFTRKEAAIIEEPSSLPAIPPFKCSLTEKQTSPESSTDEFDEILPEPLSRSSTVKQSKRTPSSITISGATTKIIKSCKLNVPVKAITRESRKLFDTVVDVLPTAPQSGTRNGAVLGPTNSSGMKKRPGFRRTRTEMMTAMKKLSLAPFESIS